MYPSNKRQLISNVCLEAVTTNVVDTCRHTHLSLFYEAVHNSSPLTTSSHSTSSTRSFSDALHYLYPNASSYWYRFNKGFFFPCRLPFVIVIASSVTTAGFFPLDLGFFRSCLGFWVFFWQIWVFFIRGHNFVFSHYYFTHSSHPWHLESSYKDICFTLLRIITHSCIITSIFSVEN